MKLAEFRRLTEHLDGDLEFCSGGAPLRCLYATDNCLSVDDRRESGFMDPDYQHEYVLFTDE